MRLFSSIILGLAAIVGLLYSTVQYIESRDMAMNKVAAQTLQSYERAKRLEFLIHLIETYRWRIHHSKTESERERLRELIRDVEQEINKLASVPR